MLERASSAPLGSARLAQRRRRNQRRGIAIFFLLFIGLSAVAAYGLEQSAVRIQNVVVYGDDASLTDYAKRAMQGKYFDIIPRDSTFFFPASSIRANILADHLDIAAVSIFRTGFTSISLKPVARVAVARWCGLSPNLGADEYCYVFDANGYVFAPAASTTATINTFTLYAPLAGDASEPLRASIAHAEEIPTVFDFARELDTLGSPVKRVVIRADEVDDYLASGTRITYVLGHENTAFTALVSARDSLNLADGSIEYIDLRFDGKMYLKRK